MQVVPQLFEGEHLVRVVMDEAGEPWFVAKDVCDVLELTNSRKALADLEEDEKGVTTGYTPGGNQSFATVNESGLYSLIFRSRKPEAKRFRKWVTSEVLPAIRKTGGYGAASPVPRQETLTVEVEETRFHLSQIAECRQVWGKRAAQELWRRSPLPQPSEEAVAAGRKEMQSLQRSRKLPTEIDLMYGTERRMPHYRLPDDEIVRRLMHKGFHTDEIEAWFEDDRNRRPVDTPKRRFF